MGHEPSSDSSAPVAGSHCDGVQLAELRVYRVTRGSYTDKACHFAVEFGDRPFGGRARQVDLPAVDVFLVEITNAQQVGDGAWGTS